MRHPSTVAALAILAVACQPRLESPAPQADALTPSLVCNDQLTTVVTLHGEHLTPLPADVLTGDPQILLPEVTLERVSALDGSSTSSESIALEAVRWVDASTMELTVSPEVGLPEGVFDLSVRNADGQVSGATGALAAVPPPTADLLDPQLTCLEQGARTLELTGQGFLVVGGTLPTVQVGELSLEPDAAEDCHDLAGPTAGQLCTTLQVTLPEDALDADVHDLFVVNPATAECTTPDPLPFEVVPAPVLSSVQPDLACTDQADRAFEIEGAGFIVLADGTTPQVTMGTYSAAPDWFDDCDDLTGPAGGQSCGRLGFTLPAGELDAGVQEVTVANPDPAGCATAEPVTFELVPPPQVAELLPDLTCLAQGGRVFVVQGEGFVVLDDGALPSIAVGAYETEAEWIDGCEPLAGGVGQVCTELGLQLPADAQDPGSHPVVVTNPGEADCVSEEPVDLDVIPPPTLDTLTPPTACLDTGEAEVVLLGANFLWTVEGDLPSVAFGTDLLLEADAVDACTVVGSSGALLCTELTVTLPADSLELGLQAVSVHNPAPGDCSSVDPLDLEIRSAPVLSSVDNTLFCTENGQTFTLTGSNFLVVDGELPTVHLGSFSAPADEVTGCSEVDASTQSCTGAVITVAPGALPEGSLAVSIRNPEGCPSAESHFVDAVPAPRVLSLAPPEVCDTAPDVALDLIGEGFLFVDGDGPTVEVGGVGFPVESSFDCEALAGGITGEVCGGLTVTIPEGTFTDIGPLDIEVTNPAPADCVSDETVPFEIVESPVVESVEPPLVCDTGFTITIHGRNFAADAQVWLDDQLMADVTVVDEFRITVDLPPDFGGGVYDVTVQNPDGCLDTLVEGVEIADMPIVFYFDPPVLYDGIRVQGTVYVSGINKGVDRVWIVEQATGDELDLDYTYSPLDPNKIFAIVPDGLEAGAYDLWVEDEANCYPVLEEAFDVVSELTVAVGEIDPPFGHTDDHTAVEIHAESPLPGGWLGFEDLPRIYLNPSDPTLETVATEVHGLSFQSDLRLDAVVPPGLALGDYDVIVVNPDGSVGHLPEAFEVTAEPPPVVDSVSPGSISNQTVQTVFIYGANFRDSFVIMDCYVPSSGSFFTKLPTVTDQDDDWLQLAVPASDGEFNNGAVCALEVHNDDGTWVIYSGLSVTNPASKMYGWEEAPDLTTARRAPAASSARATAAARYLYAIGGDDGSVAGAHATIERTSVGKFGDLVGWSELPHTLPEARTLAGIARVGRYLYLVGGNDGAGPVSTVWRAQVLDPVAAPRIGDVDIQLYDPDEDEDAGALGDGLGQGRWVYRVAALYDEAHDDNPGGESRASDPFVVRLPDLLPDKATVTLSWTADPNASGYRIYRTAEADGPSNVVTRLADISAEATSFTDKGGATDESVVPHVRGALGNWHALPSMSIEREGACVAVGQDPAAPERWYLFAAGGRDATGTVRQDIEYLPLTVVSEHDHEADEAWLASVASLQSERWQCGAYAATNRLNTHIPEGQTWIYFGAGVGDGGGINRRVSAHRVGPGGDFDQTENLAQMPSRAGYGFAVASNNLYAWGGTGGAPSTGGVFAEICAVGQAGCSPTPPDLGNWTNVVATMEHARYLPGSAQESSVFFIIGGQTNAEAATSTVEFANY